MRRFINDSYYRHYGTPLSDSLYLFLWPLIVNLLPIGFILGSLPLAKLTERIGRRNTFYFSSFCCIIGLAFQGLSRNCASFELLAIGRLVTSLGSGLSPPLEGVYYNEISPVHMRGFFCSITGIFVELGLIVGAILPLPSCFGTEALWPWIFLIQIVPCLITLAILPFLPESPRYLLSRGHLEECKRSLRFFGHTDIPSRIREIDAEINSQQTRVTWSELWRKKHLRRGVFLSMLVQFEVVFSGIVAVEFYSTNILVRVGLTVSEAQYALVGIVAPSFFTAIFGSYLVDRVGRRTLLLASTVLLIFTNTTVMLMAIIFNSASAVWTGYIAIIAFIILVMAFAIGPSILQWVMPVEMVPQNARSTVQTFVNVVKNTAYFFVGISFFPLQEAVGPFCFLVVIVPLCAFLAVYVRMLPETKNRNVVDIMRDLGYEEP